MKTHDQIRDEVSGLRARLAAKLDVYFEPTVLQSVLESKVASKTIDEIDAIVGTYSFEELLIACEINAEIDAAALEEGPPH